MLMHFFKTKDDTMLKTLDEQRTGAWTHAVAPTKEECVELVETFGLEKTILEDIKDFFEVPRFEQEGSVSYFFIRYPYDVKDLDIDTAPLLIVLGETFLLTIAEQEVPFLDALTTGKRVPPTTHKTGLFLTMLSALMTAYGRTLTRTRKLVYHDMGRVRSMRGRDLQRLVFFEQELNEMISALVPTNAWIQHLMKGNYIQMFSATVSSLKTLSLTAANSLIPHRWF